MMGFDGLAGVVFALEGRPVGEAGMEAGTRTFIRIIDSSLQQRISMS